MWTKLDFGSGLIEKIFIYRPDKTQKRRELCEEEDSKGHSSAIFCWGKTEKDRHYFPDHLIPWVHISQAYSSEQRLHLSPTLSDHFSPWCWVVNPPWGAPSLGSREAAGGRGHCSAPRSFRDKPMGDPQGLHRCHLMIPCFVQSTREHYKLIVTVAEEVLQKPPVGTFHQNL